ncbi:O-fucosyltransferase 30 [Linum perenne]
MNAGSSLLDSLRECGNVLSGRNGNIDECLYAVNEDCRTTVWTYENGDDGALDSFQADELRLLDGQFKNHWKATFQGVRQKLESLNQGDAQPINIFVMTDLPRANWSRTYLGELAKDGLVLQTARHIAKKASKDQHCPHQKLPDILLDIEESVCSCASLGFVGTAGSTIAESIQLMRKSDVCSILNRTAR